MVIIMPNANLIQLYSDDKRTQPAYPICHEDGIFDDAGNNVIADLKSDLNEIKSDFELVNDNLKSVTVAPYVVLADCQNKRIFDTSIVTGVCDAVAVANGNNLLYVNSLTVGTKTLSNGATLTVHDDYTIEYNGTNATSNQMIDVMSNGAWRYKFPFGLTLSCKFSDISDGGFNVFAYYNDGTDHNVGFVNSKLTIPAESMLSRIYISPNNKEVKFKVKININKSDEVHSYEKPDLKLVDVGNFKNTVLNEGTNWIFPYSGGWTKVPISTVESISYLKNLKNEENKVQGVHETKTMYDTLNKAIAACNYSNGDYVLVNHGTYNEKVEGRNTPKRLIGTDTDTVIIAGVGDNYDNPPVEISYGILKNLTVIEEQSTGGYCVHIDDNETENHTLLIENCKFSITGTTHAIGIGNRAGSKIVFKNCEIVSNGEGLPIYMHNTESTGTDLAQMVFENCKFVSNKDTAIRLQDWSGCCATEFLFINNTFISTDVSNAVNIQYRNYNGTSSEDSHEFKNKFSLSNGSHGNNVSYLNK